VPHLNGGTGTKILEETRGVSREKEMKREKRVLMSKGRVSLIHLVTQDDPNPKEL